MIGAILALLLVGLMRFGMGLLNIQGQVQSIVIGILLILSILLPNLPQIARESAIGLEPPHVVDRGARSRHRAGVRLVLLLVARAGVLAIIGQSSQRSRSR